MVRSTFFLTAFLACTAVVYAHPGESLEHIELEAKNRAEYLGQLNPHKRISRCKLRNDLSSKQQTSDRRQEAVQTLRKEHGIEISTPLSVDHVSVEEPLDDDYSGFRGKTRAFWNAWNGPWRSIHRRDPSTVPFSKDKLATGDLPALDWGSYNLGSTLVLAPLGTEGPYCKQLLPTKAVTMANWGDSCFG